MEPSSYHNRNERKEKKMDTHSTTPGPAEPPFRPFGDARDSGLDFSHAVYYSHDPYAGSDGAGSLAPLQAGSKAAVRSLLISHHLQSGADPAGILAEYLVIPRDEAEETVEKLREGIGYFPTNLLANEEEDLSQDLVSAFTAAVDGMKDDETRRRYIDNILTVFSTKDAAVGHSLRAKMTGDVSSDLAVIAGELEKNAELMATSSTMLMLNCLDKLTPEQITANIGLGDRFALAHALSCYIAQQRGELYGDWQDFEPEMIGFGAAAAVETSHAVLLLKKGRITLQKAANLVKSVFLRACCFVAEHLPTWLAKGIKIFLYVAVFFFTADFLTLSLFNPLLIAVLAFYAASLTAGQIDTGTFADVIRLAFNGVMDGFRFVLRFVRRVFGALMGLPTAQAEENASEEILEEDLSEDGEEDEDLEAEEEAQTDNSSDLDLDT